MTKRIVRVGNVWVAARARVLEKRSRQPRVDGPQRLCHTHRSSVRTGDEESGVENNLIPLVLLLRCDAAKAERLAREEDERELVVAGVVMRIQQA